MKITTFLLVTLVCGATAFSQTYLDVQPGYGTLDTAITEHQGNVIYRLQAGGWYTLNGQIQNSGFPLTIVGTTPAPGQMPAVIQTATLPNGTVLSYMFSILDNFTLKDVYIVNADANNTEGNSVISVAGNLGCKVVLDSVTMDPTGTGNGSGMIAFNNTPHPKLFITNSLFLRDGTLSSANDGWFWNIGGAPNNGFDTLYVENNTFMCTGTGMGSCSSFTADSENFVWINHNSFIFHKSQLFWAWRMNDYFVTNNLFFDFNTQPWNFKWNAFFPDPDTSGYMSLIEQDTSAADSSNGQLGISKRKVFVEYNTYYTDPAIQAYVKSWQYTHTLNNDGSTALQPAYLMQLAYPSDSAKVNREAGMWYSKNFPDFMFNHYIQQVDPQWTDQKFYDIQDSLAAWTLPAAELNTWGFNANDVNPQPSAAPNWFWCADTEYNYGNPVVWPRVNCSYTNSQLLTASIAGLPLGDLNWFPQAKAEWEQNKSAIMQHILSENESQMQLTSVNEAKNQVPTDFALSQNYPNPFNPTTEIAYSVPKNGFVTLKVYNVLGQEVATLFSGMQRPGNYTARFNGSKLASGVYFYTLHQGANSITKKLVLLK